MIEPHELPDDGGEQEIETEDHNRVEQRDQNGADTFVVGFQFSRCV